MTDKKEIERKRERKKERERERARGLVKLHKTKQTLEI
jgi:hypothetical protein